MKKISLDIQFEEPNKWSGWADLGSTESPEPYAVFADSLHELRELIRDFAAGDMFDEVLEFEEVLSQEAFHAARKS